MFRSIAVSTAVVLLACSSDALADHHETSTFEEFQEMGKLLVGRWVGDVKFVADWPGQALGKGERVVSYWQYAWTVDKKALHATGQVGNLGAITMIYWDSVTKRIKLTSVNTAGSTLEALLWKKSDDVYGWRLSGGGLPDGRKHSGTGEWVFSDEGRTMTIQGQTMLDDEKNDPLKDVYKRLSP